MAKLWTIMSYTLPFFVTSAVACIGWLIVTNKTMDFALFFAVLFYIFPAYVLFVVPCYIGGKYIIVTFQLRRVAAYSLALVIVSLQTMIAGSLLRVQVAGYGYLFVLFVIAMLTFIGMSNIHKEKFKII